MTARVYLVRHGETEWNRDGNRYAGRTDLDLSDFGREQARLASQALAHIPFGAVYCSTLKRSRVTAEIVAGERGLPLVVRPELVEIDFGAWEGLTREEIERDHAESWRAWRADPETARAGGTGETGREACDRMVTCIEEILAGEGAVLAVGHNSVNRLLIAGTLGMPLRNYPQLTQHNLGVNVVERQEGALRWLRINQSVIADI
jgi:broad specificity phosphatase PhoE